MSKTSRKFKISWNNFSIVSEGNGTNLLVLKDTISSRLQLYKEPLFTLMCANIGSSLYYNTFG